MDPRSSRLAEAFTVVELLVIIALIVLLMALLLPTLGKTREAARRVHCRSTLRQIGVGVTSYANDEDGYLPTLYRTSLPATTYFMRVEGGVENVNLGLIYFSGYAADPRLYYCIWQEGQPDASLRFNGPDNTWDSTKFRSSYPARHIDGLTSGAKTTWRLEPYSNKVIYSDFLGVDTWQGGGVTTGFLLTPHDGEGYNRLFGDGSAHWTQPGPLTGAPFISPSQPTSAQQTAFYVEMDDLP